NFWEIPEISAYDKGQRRIRAMRIINVGTWLALLCWSLAAAAQERFTMSGPEKKLLDLTNAEREKEKLPALRPSPLLFKVARAHAANMAKQGKMEHELDG